MIKCSPTSKKSPSLWILNFKFELSVCLQDKKGKVSAIMSNDFICIINNYSSYIMWQTVCRHSLVNVYFFPTPASFVACDIIILPNRDWLFKY